jgi:intracellular sulfur oxidation DsrE/DsrF family protein
VGDQSVTLQERECHNPGMFRRTFLSLSSAGALFAPLQPAPIAKPGPRPARHSQDDWLDQAPDGHRVIFDTWMADKFGEAVGFAGNWARVNKEEYGLTDADLAIVIVARHGSAPFAFNEAMWTKYGKHFAANMSANDKVAHPNPSTNVQAARLQTLAKQGMRLAVCNLTTRAYSRILAKETGGDPETIYKELTANAVAPATFVPAGIVAVTRAQERGYALVSIG